MCHIADIDEYCRTRDYTSRVYYAVYDDKPLNCLLYHFSRERREAQAGASKWWTNMCTNKPNYRINENISSSFFLMIDFHVSFSHSVVDVISSHRSQREKIQQQIVIKHVVHKTEMHHHQPHPRCMWRIFSFNFECFRENCFVASAAGARFTNAHIDILLASHTRYKFINSEIVKNIACMRSAAVKNIAQVNWGLDFCNHTELILSQSWKIAFCVFRWIFCVGKMFIYFLFPMFHEKKEKILKNGKTLFECVSNNVKRLHLFSSNELWKLTFFPL